MDTHPAAKSAYFKTGQVIIYDQNVADRFFARFAGSSTISFNQAISAELGAFTSYLNPKYKLPSRNTLVSLIQEEADRAKDMIKDLLKEAPMVSLILKF